MKKITKKVLLIRLSSLGDVVFNIPLANVLKANGYTVDWIVSEKGYEIVPISELIYKDNYYMDNEGRQKLNS